MERVPKVSDSRRLGREAMSSGFEAVVAGRAPGVKVDGAKICFMVDLVCCDYDAVVLWSQFAMQFQLIGRRAERVCVGSKRSRFQVESAKWKKTGGRTYVASSHNIQQPIAVA